MEMSDETKDRIQKKANDLNENYHDFLKKTATNIDNTNTDLLIWLFYKLGSMQHAFDVVDGIFAQQEEKFKEIDEAFKIINTGLKVVNDNSRDIKEKIQLISANLNQGGEEDGDVNKH